MELSISPYKLFLVAGIVVGGLYLRSTWSGVPGGKAPMPEPLREMKRDMDEVIDKLPGAEPGGHGREVERTAPSAPSTTRPPDTAPDAATPEKKPPRVFTPDEKARSAIALADGYAENGLFDKAYQKLEEAEALEVSDAVKAELVTAKDRVTKLMRSRR
jgi:hypothetical protein